MPRPTPKPAASSSSPSSEDDTESDAASASPAARARPRRGQCDDDDEEDTGSSDSVPDVEIVPTPAPPRGKRARAAVDADAADAKPQKDRKHKNTALYMEYFDSAEQGLNTLYTCKLCGKSGQDSTHIKVHFRSPCLSKIPAAVEAYEKCFPDDPKILLQSSFGDHGFKRVAGSVVKPSQETLDLAIGQLLVRRSLPFLAIDTWDECTKVIAFINDPLSFPRLLFLSDLVSGIFAPIVRMFDAEAESLNSFVYMVMESLPESIKLVLANPKH